MSLKSFISHRTNSKWFNYLKRPIKPKLTIVCFPFAGGDASFYQNWATEIKADVQIISIQFPGRANRFLESPYTNLNDLIVELIKNWECFIETPYVLFGHSLGGLAIYELTRILNENNQMQPLHLFISGCKAPHLLKNKERYLLPKQAFIEMIKEMDGTPKEIVENQEMMDLLVPMLRADFQLIETYTHQEKHKRIRLPITLMGGTEDPEVGMEDLEAWKSVIEGPCKLQLFQGGHFFLKDSEKEFFDFINTEIEEII
jgi:medium-chain acyl-[acyl-carrier-protein] hydrolase